MEDKDKKLKIKELIGPSYEQRNLFLEGLQNISYYIMIVLLSILMLFVVPLFSGCLYGDYMIYFPTTPEAWTIYIIMRASNAIGNVAMLVFFKLQAKVNIKDNKDYQQACDIMNRLYAKTRIARPRSPGRMNAQEYTGKGLSLVIMTILTTVTITALVISFDIISFISMIVSVMIGILFGWTTMIKNEVYWTHEYLLYAQMIQEELNDDKGREQDISESGRASSEEPV